MQESNTPSPEAIVRAALERASGVSSPWGSCGCSQDIYTLASNPAEVAAIISAAGQLKKAGETNET
jgi:hypothetical protein